MSLDVLPVSIGCRADPPMLPALLWIFVGACLDWRIRIAADASDLGLRPREA